MLVPVVSLAPIALVVTSRDSRRGRHAAHGDVASSDRPELPFRKAFRNRTFRLLVAGFTTCGFHMVIIESHLFDQSVLEGIDAGATSWAFSVYGIATIFGALLSGWLGGLLPDATGGYAAVWGIDVAACVFASVMSARIGRGERGLA